MDLWVVAAAAGAGYMGKYWQNLSLSEKERLLRSSSSVSTHRSLEAWNFLQQIRDRTCPLKRLAREKAYREVFAGQNHFLNNESDGDPDFAFDSASTGDRVQMVEDFRARWLKSFEKISGKERYLHNAEPSCGICKKKVHKNRSSRVNTLQIVEEEIDHVLLATMKPLLPAQENQAEESFDHSSFDLWPAENPSSWKSSHDEFDIREDTCNLSGSSSFDSWINVREATPRKNISSDESCTCVSTSSANDMDSVEALRPETGSQKRMIDGAVHSPGQSNEMLLFLVGLTIGMLPRTDPSSKSEVQKINDKLEQAMSLVQDLKEELDMRENLTVKELKCGSSQSSSTKSPLFDQELSLSISEQEPDHITSYGTKLADDEKSDNDQLMSRIEAELEAELERLQLNIDLERTSNFVELDLQSKGETFRRHDDDSESESDEESDPMTKPANYPVSPRELSIRLHELMESQLEARIQELERALQINQDRFNSLDPQCNASLLSADEYNNTDSPITPESW